MSDLILKMSISLDGFVGDGHGDKFVFRTLDDQSNAWTLDVIRGAGFHAMGRKTFGDMAKHWPSSTEVFAGPMNNIPKVVFTHGSDESRTAIRRSLDTARQAAEASGNLDKFASWAKADIRTGNLADEVARLKQESAKPIVVYGGAELVSNLVAEDLVDEYQFLVHPVALGKGLPIFTRLGEQRDLSLVDVKRFGEGGSVAHIYRRRRAKP